MRPRIVVRRNKAMRHRVDPALEDYLRDRVAGWLSEEPGRTAQALADLAGVSAGQISAIQSGTKGLGYKTAKGLAHVFGFEEDLVAALAVAKEWSSERSAPRSPPTAPPASDVATTTGRLYRELEGWTEAAEAAAKQERAPAYAIEAAGLGVVSWAVREVTVDLVTDEAMRWLKHAPLDVRRAAETAAATAKSNALALRSGEVRRVPPSGNKGTVPMSRRKNA
jgi:transcriptional regulator with XRE-family HTH domain